MPENFIENIHMVLKEAEKNEELLGDLLPLYHFYLPTIEKTVKELRRLEKRKTAGNV